MLVHVCICRKAWLLWVCLCLCVYVFYVRALHAFVCMCMCVYVCKVGIVCNVGTCVYL